jgi:1-phosphofructokinase family hexose kinase
MRGTAVILCAGLSPAWQQILVFDAFRLGHVNRARTARWCASGKVLNAGIAVHHLGGPALTIAPLGGPPRPQIEAEFQSLGAAGRWVPAEAATRVCTTILDRGSGEITELVENARPIRREERDRFGAWFREEAGRADVVVFIGSLPADTPDDFYRQVLHGVRCPLVLDFRGPGLLSVLELEPYVVKPNREELAQTLGRPLGDDQALLEGMRSLNDQGAAWVVVTQGAGPVWISSCSEAYRLHPPGVAPLINPIGCGDALAATIARATRDGAPLPTAVRLGLAAAAQNARQLLPCRIRPEMLAAESEEIRVERVD